jgi:hypothetical protein
MAAPNYGKGRRCNYGGWRSGIGEWLKLLDEAKKGRREGLKKKYKKEGEDSSEKRN